MKLEVMRGGEKSVVKAHTQEVCGGVDEVHRGAWGEA